MMFMAMMNHMSSVGMSFVLGITDPEYLQRFVHELSIECMAMRSRSEPINNSGNVQCGSRKPRRVPTE